jgi:hypothetical protein
VKTVKKLLLLVTIVAVLATVGIAFVRRSLVPEKTAETQEKVETPIQISVADLYKVPEPKADGTLVGEFGPLFPEGTIYEILEIKDIVYEGTKMKEAHIYLPKQSKILATADGTVSLSEEGGTVGLVPSRIVVVVAAAYDSQVFVEHNSSVRRGDELMLSSGPCPEDKNATVLVVFYPHGLGEASKEDREKAMKDFLELLELGSVNPGGL